MNDLFNFIQTILLLVVWFKLDNTNKKLRRIIMTQDEMKNELDVVTGKVTKIGTETRTLLTRIDELEAAINAGGEITPAVQDALAALKAQAEIADELVPDAP